MKDGECLKICKLQLEGLKKTEPKAAKRRRLENWATRGCGRTRCFIPSFPVNAVVCDHSSCSRTMLLQRFVPCASLMKL